MSSPPSPPPPPPRLPRWTKAQLAAATVVVAGHPYPDDMDVFQRTSFASVLTPEHVSWLRTADGHEVACLRSPGGTFRKCSLQHCRAMWPDVSWTSVGCNRRVVRPGVTVPILPADFYASKRRTRRKKRPRPVPAVATTWHRFQPSWDRVTIVRYVPPASFWSDREESDTTVPSSSSSWTFPTRLATLLASVAYRGGEATASGTADPAVSASFVRDHPLDRVTTLAHLQAYPYRRLLVQFYAHFFPPDAVSSPSTVLVDVPPTSALRAVPTPSVGTSSRVGP